MRRRRRRLASFILFCSILNFFSSPILFYSVVFCSIARFEGGFASLFSARYCGSGNRIVVMWPLPLVGWLCLLVVVQSDLCLIMGNDKQQEQWKSLCHGKQLGERAS